MRSHSLLSLALCTLLFCIGCTPNTLYRNNFLLCQANEEDCSSSSVIHHAQSSAREFYLGFTEFDDQGQVYARNQLESLIQTYTELAGDEDIILSVFVHGWHHTAKAGDTNIESYQKLLGDIAANENAMAPLLNRKPRKVLGVYLGWRGESLTTPVIHHLTFWDRKKVAHEVGLQGVTEVLIKLEQIVNVQNTRTPLHDSRMISIGHSFGGAVLFTSLQQLMVDRFFDSQPGKSFQGDARGFGDLVLLINPAFEAMRYSTLFDIAQDHCRRYFSSQMPRMLILTSEGDDATGTAFPAGRFFSTLFESHKHLSRYECVNGKPRTRKIRESSADRIAVGHFTPFHSHLMKPQNKITTGDTMAQLLKLQLQWQAQEEKSTLDFSSVKLTHLGITTPFNPYLNVYVDKKIIPDHNNIWGESVIQFIQEMVLVTTNNEATMRAGFVPATTQP